MRIFGTHWFKGEKDNAIYSGWHTGINLQKCFQGKPLLITCWIPLQDLTSDTGGRLWYYNGPHQVSWVDVIRHANKNNMVLQYVLLQNYCLHVDDYKITEDIKSGDCFVFREIMPHSVDKDSHGVREILSVRLVDKTAEIDEEFFQELDKEIAEQNFAFGESLETIKVLKEFCGNIRDTAVRNENKKL